MPNTVENNAITFATEYLRKQGYVVENVSRGKRPGSEHRGYDLLARKSGEEPVRIEVKGCTREWGIPDPYVTEFDAEKRLIADFLYVVYFLDGASPQLCAIPRDALKPEYIVPKSGYRISSRFKNKKSLEPYFRPSD
jgi:Protein NO VEIN, C-terminal